MTFKTDQLERAATHPDSPLNPVYRQPGFRYSPLRNVEWFEWLTIASVLLTTALILLILAAVVQTL